MHWRSSVLVVACVGTLAAGTAGVANAAPGPQAAPSPAGLERHSVTLLTGDVVQVERQPGGKQAATVRPAPGREKIRFHQQEVDGHLSVFPEDVTPRLAAKQVDRTLFDVTELIAEGYADEQSATLPLILSYRKGTDLRKTTAAADLGATLTSVNGRSARAAKANAKAFWASSGNIERISLDRKVRVSLDRSVPQIGAPEAWAAGYDGTGTTVAVLDTGFDPTHPDLAGRVSRGGQDFTDQPRHDRPLRPRHARRLDDRGLRRRVGRPAQGRRAGRETARRQGARRRRLRLRVLGHRRDGVGGALRRQGRST